ncbi:endonuclease/exonuclease/phosphatase family protein [Actinocorallia sp. A-T 12471]|uniref:endonuclease/exonuclease/phosphatase family protein n=1 Tax=Actinocorallia sp. A-T 12471 TaxID=3089813 RepID=UPI0029CECCF6|nr:endonuclease/exonuclease/phosphatase family protein [Actinocorallia sp. A-T 12471]MDX6742849.1 endonuclease/exonuclease/phosphatase family protein [Actinocorallia sp. A-T 12471]
MTETLPRRRTGHRIAWAAAALWTTWAVARTVGADRIPHVGGFGLPLLALTPFAAATSIVPVGLALALRNRRAALLAAGAAAVLAASVLPRAFAASAPSVTGPNVRILTVNLMFGRADAAQIVNLVAAHKVDVLSVQEFTPDALAAFQENGLDELLPHSVLAPQWGAEGSGLYSRHPLTALPPIHGTVLHQPRASLTLDGRAVHVTAVHPLPPISPSAVADWRHTYASFPSASADGAVQILAGDFNSTLDHAAFRGLLARGYTDAADARGSALTPTWGVTMMGPPLTLDHIVTSSTVAVRAYSVHPITGTDHRAVLATLHLP